MTRLIGFLVGFGLLCVVASYLSGCLRDGAGSYSLPSSRAPTKTVCVETSPGVMTCRSI